jgi:hypothetical protein
VSRRAVNVKLRLDEAGVFVIIQRNGKEKDMPPRLQSAEDMYNSLVQYIYERAAEVYPDDDLEDCPLYSIIDSLVEGAKYEAKYWTLITDEINFNREAMGQMVASALEAAVLLSDQAGNGKSEETP